MSLPGETELEGSRFRATEKMNQVAVFQIADAAYPRRFLIILRMFIRSIRFLDAYPIRKMPFMKGSGGSLPS